MSTAPRPHATYGALIALAWPIIISRASQVVIGLSDAVMVADLGAASLAATATGATNAFTLLIFPMGICFIIASFSSQLFGRGEAPSARRFAWYGLMIALVTQGVVLVSLNGIDAALGLFNYQSEVRTLMAGYLRVRLLGGGAVIGIEALSNYYGGLGRTRPGMAANLVAMGLNVVLNWMFIWGHLGAPALGVKGAALANTLATGTAFVGFFTYFLLDGRGLPRPTLNRGELLRVLRFGLPSGLNWFFEFLAFIFFINVVVAGLGTPALAAMNSVITLSSVAFMPAFGLATAGAILVGQAIGARALQEVPRTVKMTLLTAAGWQGLVGLLYLGLPRLLMTPFARGADAHATMEIGVRMIMVSAAWQLFDATATTFAEALRGAGDTLFPLLARLAVAWLVFVPGAYLSVRVYGHGEVVATFWLVAYLGLLALVLALRFRSGAWKKVVLVEPA